MTAEIPVSEMVSFHKKMYCLAYVRRDLNLKVYKSESDVVWVNTFTDTFN